MAGFINWNNMGSITETSDAIAEREQALEPVPVSYTHLTLPTN